MPSLFLYTPHPIPPIGSLFKLIQNLSILTTSTVDRLAHTTICCQLDYLNSFLTGDPAKIEVQSQHLSDQSLEEWLLQFHVQAKCF